MSITLSGIQIHVSQEITISNTENGSVVLKPGNYIAFPQAGSHEKACDLYRADAKWSCEETPLAAVFIGVDDDLKVRLS